MEVKTELQEIREAFGASRAQFAKVFLGVSANMISFYETGRCKTPEKLLKIARAWKAYLDTMNGKKHEERTDNI